MTIAHLNGVNIWYQQLGDGPHLSGHEGYATVTQAMSGRFRVLDFLLQ